MRLTLIYTPCATSSRENTGNIMTFAQFEEGYLQSEIRNDAGISDKSNDDPIIPPLLSKHEMNAMNYGYDSDHDPISTEMLEDIRDRSQYHPNFNRREARYKIDDHIKQSKSEFKAA